MNAAGLKPPPPDFEESPELTDEDFARARRMSHGRLVEPVPQVASTLRALLASLDAEDADDARIGGARAHIAEALRLLDDAATRAAE
jgi:hypothetical protein